MRSFDAEQGLEERGVELLVVVDLILCFTGRSPPQFDPVYILLRP